MRAGCPSSEASSGGTSGGGEDCHETKSGNRESEDEHLQHDDSFLADELAESRAHEELTEELS